MCSTLSIRNDINEYKSEYNESGNKLLLLYTAIYKGMYLALGGKKGIALSSKLDNVVYYSTIIFKYKLKMNNCNNQEVAVNYLMKNMRENFKQPSYYLNGKIPVEDTDIANLLADIISSENTEDLIINHKNIYNISLEALGKI